MEKENLDGLIIVPIRGNFKIMLYKVEENMYGLMGDGMRAIGLIIKYKLFIKFIKMHGYGE